MSTHTNPIQPAAPSPSDPASANLVQIQPAPGGPLKKLDRTATGPKYWRSLDHLANTPEFRQWVEREFPAAADLLDGKSRRTMLKLMAASFGLAGLAACSRPELHLAPEARLQEDYLPGMPYNYTSAFALNGHSAGLVVETYDGRPVKVEGNPDHPASLGAATALAQASLLDVYDPDRSREILSGGQPRTWEDFTAAVAGLNLGDGAGLRFLSETVTSPTIASLRGQILERYPSARWVEYDAIARDSERAGTQVAFGQALNVHPQFDRARVIASLDYDFLGVDYPTPLATKLFSRRRRPASEADLDNLSRLYVVESQFSLTGANAEHRLGMRGSEVWQFAADLLNAVQGGAVTGEEPRAGYLRALAADLMGAGSEALVVAGPRQPAAVHALAHQINQVLGANGQTVLFTPAASAAGVLSGLTALQDLTGEMRGGQVSTLFILGGNPAYSAPADLDFAGAMASVANTIHLGGHDDETAEGAGWHIPEAHYLECWGDTMTPMGQAAVQQPMISPMYGSKSAIEVLAVVLGEVESSAYQIVKDYWIAQFADDAENTWRRALNDGILPGPAPVPVAAAVNTGQIQAALANPPAAGEGLEVAFVPSAAAWDGRFANNAWMQEIPDPITKLTWDNALLVAPATAREQGLASGDMVRLSGGGRDLEAAVMIQPGQVEGSATIALGYGRTRTGRVGQGVGFNANLIRSTGGFWYGAGFTMERTGATHEHATTQDYGLMQEPEFTVFGEVIKGRVRPVVRETTVAEFRAEPEVIAEMEEVPELESLHPFRADYSEGYQWGMSIDLGACTGCNACVVACQAENNIPVVGKTEVLHRREMHWMRIDRYYVGPEEAPRAVEQPVPCQQCENAPCEYVCPVLATTHTEEGLNDMVYNRCVGTRYCLNNCPYKVRHFNFLNYHKNMQEVTHLVQNPDVSVRMRGIMEKCTYCVQRIQEARITAQNDGRRPIAEGEILTACQQTCPAEAIVFGNINDPNSRVSRLKQQERNYAMLSELNVRPRTTYLGRIRNVNPALETAADEEGEA